MSAALAWLTVSDTRSAVTDRSGAEGRRLVEQAGHRILEQRILPDEPHAVRRQVEAWLDDGACDGVLVSGGTGIAPRDRSYEALAPLLERRLDGFGELFRMLSYREIGSAAMLSRAVAGIARGRLLVVMPGSPAAVVLALRSLVLPELAHVLGELRRPA